MFCLRYTMKGGKGGGSYVSFLQQLLTLLFDDTRKEITDLEHLPSQSLTNIFASGFGYKSTFFNCFFKIFWIPQTAWMESQTSST